MDHTKAFDSVDFEFIHKTIEVFNFGETFRKWMKILYKGGKSCVSNNGFISATFPIERSTRQGDPISPLIFIVVLELLLISIRADENIVGIKVCKNEVKLTAYADDASYFLKDKESARYLLTKIEQFSKISGLEINRTKSECLLLDFELGIDKDEASLFGIPIVENLKILGHYFGKNKMICEYNNFYSKLKLIEKIIQTWKQRSLSLLGKNILVNSLVNSLILFNAQIEIPLLTF